MSSNCRLVDRGAHISTRRLPSVQPARPRHWGFFLDESSLFCASGVPNRGRARAGQLGTGQYYTFGIVSQPRRRANNRGYRNPRPNGPEEAAKAIE
jgi:hypothetical protein